MNSYLISNYKGKYTLKAEIDLSTGDFCRDKDGNLDNYSDIWIECAGKGKVFHYGGNKLLFYIPSIGRGHNIIKAIFGLVIGNVEPLGNDYKTIYTSLISNGIIFEIEETDEEILFKFKANSFDKLEPIIKPKTYGADRSPFSVKNLKKGKPKYIISLEDLNEYKEITSSISKEDLSIYNKINKGFLTQLSKKKHKDVYTFNYDIKLSGMKFKEYMHSLGKEIWNDYLSYIKNYIKQGA